MDSNENNKRLSKIENKLESIESTLCEINVTLAKNTVSLEEHIRRTNILEEKMEPVEAHVHMVNGGFKVLGFLSVVLGLVAGFLKLIVG